MKCRVPLSGTAVCFVQYGCGDAVGDDGRTSHHRTITVTGAAACRRGAPALISHFLQQNIFVLGAERGPF